MGARGRIVSARDATRAVALHFGKSAGDTGAPLAQEAFLERERVRRAIEQRHSQEQQHRQVLELAQVLAERLLGATLRLDRTAIVDLAREVLREAAGARRVTLVCSPADEAELRAAIPRFREAFEISLEVTCEPGLAAGDLLLESELGSTDARIATRLEHLLEVLKGAVIA